jgi:acetylornithine deacetylase/succinyl-diaminopimelate desuccinylase-like protein
MSATGSSDRTRSGRLAKKRPSEELDQAAWEAVHEELVRTVRELITLPTINPPGNESLAAAWIQRNLASVGVRSRIVEPAPGRGSLIARLRGDGTGGGPLLLLCHTDVVPAPEAGWSHPPFAGDLAGGYIWGRGALDMKAMVAMELVIVRMLAAEARKAGRNPNTDPIPGLTRDIIFAATADEETGGYMGAGWIVDHEPDLLRADLALTEAGGISMSVAGQRFYPIQVAEKGWARVRITTHGRWGHGSMPGTDAHSVAENAAVTAARVVERLSAPTPLRITPAAKQLLDGVRPHLTRPVLAALERVLHAERNRARPFPTDSTAESTDDATTDAETIESADATAALDPFDGPVTCRPEIVRALAATLRNTVSPNVIRAGVKHNVIPGVAELEVDVRLVPGSTKDDAIELVRRMIGPALARRCTLEVDLWGPPVEQELDPEVFALLADALRAHDPEGIPVPALAPFSTDAKHMQRIGVPTYGFSPLRLEPDERFFALFHGDDERVSLDALRFGLPVLYDVVRTYCG